MAWRLCVDRGGTFTDVVLVAPDGTLSVHKLLSRDAAGEEGLARAVKLAQARGAALSELRLGTTVATNALLERRGARVTLALTHGFSDLLRIDDQRRPELFELAIQRPPPLPHDVLAIHERVDANGQVLRTLDEDRLRDGLRDVEHLAVCLMHADRFPEHELRVARIAREVGVPHITLSHEVTPSVGYLARASTTLLDAALTPVLQASLRDSPTASSTRRLAMQSSGGLVDVAHFRGKDAVLSGPAGGVVAVRDVARRAGLQQVLGVDMGGTSTDVCRWDADGAALLHEGRIDGLRLRAPRLDLVTVAAGGGSLLQRVDGRFCVGPQSAGAQPGPACYGRGGPATLTDAALVLGLLRPAFFPSIPLDVHAARAALAAFGDPVDAARGFLEVAHERTAAAVRQLSVARGKDPREHALVAFGGAGAQHACALARQLGVRTVLVPAHAGVLSAWGLARADLVAHRERPVLEGVDTPDFPDAEARDALLTQGATEVQLTRRIDARYLGAEAALTLPWSDDWRADFAARHREAHGFERPGHPIELVSARVEARAAAALPDEAALPLKRQAAVPLEDPDPHDGTAHADRPLYRRAELEPGAWLTGPALIVEDHASTLVDAGWRCQVDGYGQLRLDDERPDARSLTLGDHADPVGLELFGQRLMALATEMGEQLRRVAHSTNIKERLDFSCALFNTEGELLANAPHIPVHLGAMGECVRDLAANVELREGDAWLSNDPARGGSHLPDLTVVTPVFHAGERVGFVANRGHHADLGGSQPGSMPPDSTRLEQEGALLSRVLLLRDGELREADVRARLNASGTRGIAERLADLRAQVACNRPGEQRLSALAAELGHAQLARWNGHLLDHGEAVMAHVVATLQPGSATRRLDDGTPISVAIHADNGRAVIDFAGTGPRGAHNRQAPRAVVRACVLYVFRCLARRSVPLNEGCFRKLEVRIPRACLLDPQPGDAVVGGNVETAQVLVDVLLAALDVQAASQGTMNNLTFGDDDFGCYETVGGGSGAGFGHDGASGVHTHMTNTAITDPEVLERRHPVHVERFELRRGSGGHGVWRGGDGLIRALRFTRPLQSAVLAESRAQRPRGLRAGDGLPGRQALSPRGATLWTPGGAGYSPDAAQWAAMSAAEARALFAQDRWRGPTTGIALNARRAQLLVIPSAALEQVLAALASDPGCGELLHVGEPGEARCELVGQLVALDRELPLYERRSASRDGRTRGVLLSSAPTLTLAADERVLLVEGRSPSPLAFPSGCGAPQRELLFDA
ncbi:MAG: 5-oxoprolinase [Planctomycetota bacterium]|nr:MAG: 5-oxoprolinase [Planctomycetota bacterium]